LTRKSQSCSQGARRRSHPTLAISPFAGAAYNDGSNALAAQYGLGTDQRGQPRVQDGIVDIGAYETKFSLQVI
jgi:hypothetical protein